MRRARRGRVRGQGSPAESRAWDRYKGPRGRVAAVCFLSSAAVSRLSAKVRAAGPVCAAMCADACASALREEALPRLQYFYWARPFVCTPPFAFCTPNRPPNANHRSLPPASHLEHVHARIDASAYQIAFDIHPCSNLRNHTRTMFAKKSLITFVALAALAAFPQVALAAESSSATSSGEFSIFMYAQSFPEEMARWRSCLATCAEQGRSARFPPRLQRDRRHESGEAYAPCPPGWARQRAAALATLERIYARALGAPAQPAAVYRPIIWASATAPWAITPARARYHAFGSRGGPCTAAARRRPDARAAADEPGLGGGVTLRRFGGAGKLVSGGCPSYVLLRLAVLRVRAC